MIALGQVHTPAREVRIVRTPEEALPRLPGPSAWEVGVEAAAAALLCGAIALLVIRRRRRDPLESAFGRMANAMGLSAIERRELRERARRLGLPGPAVLLVCDVEPPIEAAEPREAEASAAA